MAKKKKTEETIVDVTAVGNSFSSNYAEVFKAHYTTQLAVCLWGSSGYGKTSSVKEAAKELGYKVVDMRLSYRDPLTLFMPRVSSGKIEYIFSDILDVLFQANEPTIVFLDEITNPSSPEIYNVMKELLNERTILGRKISDKVLFIAASNWASEDIGVKELPDSLMARMTHLVHAPDRPTMLSKMQPFAREFFGTGATQSLLPTGHVENLNLRPCPRQIDSCERLYTVGGLRGDALRQVCSGRLGAETGVAFAKFLSEQDTKKGQDSKNVLSQLPAELTREAVPTLLQAEKEGFVMEIITYLTASKHPSPAVGFYLGVHAGPEICKAMFERKYDLGARVSPDDYPIMRDHPEYREEDSHLVIWPQVAYHRHALEIGTRQYVDEAENGAA